MAENDCIAVSEGANMPCKSEAIKVFHDNIILFAPGKAENDCIAVSALEMSQNSIRMSCSHEALDNRPHNIMEQKHDKCVQYGENEDHVGLVKGANIASFIESG